MQEEASEFAAFIELTGPTANTTSVSRCPAPTPSRPRSWSTDRKPSRWANKLRERFAGQRIAVCLELSHGPIVSALLEHDIFVIYPINPSTLAKYRRAFTQSCQDDNRTPPSPWSSSGATQRNSNPCATRARTCVRSASSKRGAISSRSVRLANRLTFTLKAYFPQILDWFRDKETEVFVAFLERWPSLPGAQRARRRDHRRSSTPWRSSRFGHRSPASTPSSPSGR